MHRAWILAALAVLCLRDAATANDAKVLIIGGGMTGILAGKTLHEAGEEDFIILESASRLGGRMWHIPFGGVTVELGALFMHGGGPNNPVFQRAQDLGLDFELARYFSFAVRDDQGNDVTDEANALYDRLEPALEAADEHSYHLQCERPDKADTSYRRILQQYGWVPKTSLERAIDYFETEWDIAQYPDGSSTRHYYEFGKGGDFNAFDYIVTDSRGYASIVESFADDFLAAEGDQRLRLSQRVTEVLQNETHVTVLTSGGETFTGEYLLNTVSLGVLQAGDIAHDPPFEEDKYEAIMQHQMSTYLQAYLKFDESVEAFWDEAQWIVYAGPRWRHWNAWMNLNTLHAGCNILQATVTGEEAVRVEQLSNAEVREELMAVLRNMYGADIPEPTSVLVPRWSQLTSFRGSYSDWPAGYTLEQNRALRKPHGRRVHFAGEAMSTRYFGYVHGAYFEGVRGADFLMECMDAGGDCDMPVADECPVRK